MFDLSFIRHSGNFPLNSWSGVFEICLSDFVDFLSAVEEIFLEVLLSGDILLDLLLRDCALFGLQCFSGDDDILLFFRRGDVLLCFRRGLFGVTDLRLLVVVDELLCFRRGFFGVTDLRQNVS